jgi:hypothetical protein
MIPLYGQVVDRNLNLGCRDGDNTLQDHIFIPPAIARTLPTALITASVSAFPVVVISPNTPHWTGRESCPLTYAVRTYATIEQYRRKAKLILLVGSRTTAIYHSVAGRATKANAARGNTNLHAEVTNILQQLFIA